MLLLLSVVGHVGLPIGRSRVLLDMGLVMVLVASWRRRDIRAVSAERLAGSYGTGLKSCERIVSGAGSRSRSSRSSIGHPRRTGWLVRSSRGRSCGERRGRRWFRGQGLRRLLLETWRWRKGHDERRLVEMGFMLIAPESLFLWPKLCSNKRHTYLAHVQGTK